MRRRRGGILVKNERDSEICLCLFGFGEEFGVGDGIPFIVVIGQKFRHCVHS